MFKFKLFVIHGTGMTNQVSLENNDEQFHRNKRPHLTRRQVIITNELRLRKHISLAF